MKDRFEKKKKKKNKQKCASHIIRPSVIMKMTRIIRLFHLKKYFLIIQRSAPLHSTRALFSSSDKILRRETKRIISFHIFFPRPIISDVTCDRVARDDKKTLALLVQSNVSVTYDFFSLQVLLLISLPKSSFNLIPLR